MVRNAGPLLTAQNNSARTFPLTCLRPIRFDKAVNEGHRCPRRPVNVNSDNPEVLVDQLDAPGQQRFEVIHALRPGQIQEELPQVAIRLDAVGLGGFDQRVQIGARLRAVSAPPTLSLNSQFLRPITNGRIAFSARLLCVPCKGTIVPSV